MNWSSRRSSLTNKTRTGRWGRRLLYFLAVLGGLSLAGLFFLAYLALQVPEERLAVGALPQPGVGRLEPWPLPTGPIPSDPAAAAGPAADTSAYAAFHLAKPQSSDLSPGQSPRARAKPKGRPANSKKTKQSS